MSDIVQELRDDDLPFGVREGMAYAAADEIERVRAENYALRQTLHDELDENLRIRALGGARDDEPFTPFIERVISERAAAKALLREVYEKACSAEIGLRDTYILQGSIYTLWDRIHAALGDEPADSGTGHQSE